MVKIEIKTDNAAFSEYPGIEIARILRKLANLLSDCVDKDLVNQTVPLLDINGNRVGVYEETKDE